DHLFCVSMLEEALQNTHPVIFNTDQGSQFTSAEFSRCLLDREILISMDGRGRALDNRLVPVDNSLIFINFMNRLRAKRTDSLTNRF
ncbi:MAG: Mobile element protein, partial [Olavius algarvensis Gamma 1 endosymbiont]